MGLYIMGFGFDCLCDCFLVL